MIVFRKILVIAVLGIPLRFYSEGIFVIISTAIGFSIRLIASAYQAVMEGNQRVDITQKVLIYWLLYNFISTLIALSIFPSIYALGVIFVVGNILIFCLLRMEAKKKYKYTNIKFRYIDIKLLKSILPYSILVHLTSLIILLREPLLKVVI